MKYKIDKILCVLIGIIFGFFVRWGMEPYKPPLTNTQKLESLVDELDRNTKFSQSQKTELFINRA